MEFWCESNATTRNFKVNDEFNEFGRTFKITNVYYKDGIVHLVAEVTLENPHIDAVNRIEITGISSEVPYQDGDLAQIIVTLYTNDVEQNGTITYESSNVNVATVDSTGAVTFVGIGTVTFSVYWQEQNLYESVTVTATEATPIITDDYRIGLTANNQIIKVGGSKTVTCKLYRNNEEIELTDAVATWTYNTSWYNCTPSYDSTTNKAKLKINSGTEIGDDVITLTVTEPHYNATGSMTFSTQWM